MLPEDCWPTGAAAHREATPAEIAAMKADMESGFRQGALAEGMGVNYTPGATRLEIVEMFESRRSTVRPCMCTCDTQD